MWLFYPGTAIGFGSRKEEYVDSSGDPKSLFWKIREFIGWLPEEFRPHGWDPRKHAPFMRITNPENGSFIGGESGDNIGRGARTSIYFVDESAHLERPEVVDAALSQTSNCIYHLSSVNGPGNPFARKRHSGKHRVFTFHWRDDPRKDEAWYQRQKDILDPVILAQEVDIDYNASMGDAWIPGDLIAAAQRLGPADVESLGPWRIAIDAAHEGQDESVIHRRRGRLNLPQIIRKGFDGVQLAAEVVQECDRLEWAGGEIFDITIELDGPGVSCYDQLRKSKYAGKVYGVHTGARAGDDRNYNIRARAWREARDYLASPPVCLDRDPELKAQLGSVKYRYKDGLLLMEDKREYKKRNGGRSPDRADAFVLTFANPADPSIHALRARHRDSREYDPYQVR
jgi:hypothetical protein